MTWIHFLIWLLGIYILYYLAMILWDLSRNKVQAITQQNDTELTFSETVAPKMAADYVGEVNNGHPASTADDPGMVLPEVIASGGVPLKDVFRLARKEVIVYTRQVSFQ